MKSCNVCGGFLVEGDGCPNCAVDAASPTVAAGRSRAWVRIATAVAVAGTALTLAACYGAPPDPVPSPDAGPAGDAGQDAGRD